MAKLKVGLIGAGSMGSLHARVISSSPWCELACVVDPNEANGQSLAHRFDSQWRPKLDDVNGLDAVVIAAATETHHQLGVALLGERVPLLIEKPLADTLAHTEEILAASIKADVPLMCGLLERFNPAVLAAMNFVEAPQHVSATRHSPYVSRIRTGVASDLLIHDVDVILRMTKAAPVSVSGQLGFNHPESAAGAEDVADVTLLFDSGLVASASASRLSQRKVRSMSIAELDRLIEVDLLRQDITIYRHIGASASDEETGLGYRQQTVIDIPMIMNPREPLVSQLEHFVDLIEGRADADEERGSLLAPHLIVDQLRSAASAGLDR